VSGERLLVHDAFFARHFEPEIAPKLAAYVDPRGTTNSREHGEIMRRYSLDRHVASAYLIALKGPKQP